MNHIITRQARARAALVAAVSRRIPGPRDRGDVPGWVLITIMTAGLVTALWAIAGPQLGQLFSDAISNVKGP
ncbi:hypothetical protein GCM10009868_13910 [Terrabacter aerolatus]|uniref:Uncharacterized protein n=1 Tax=Terrabacter aerolatus TaxID=422442 RepID=A0A512D3L8_9MICO|nr:hypothetical protein [Terrabacter aerolatus]GEO31042.1 hypothetical protein TAE01_28520 [Terrabacter aerolatus]